jgi:hypothetical protein
MIGVRRNGVMVSEKLHRGIELQRWAHKTPYNLFGCFVQRPIMRESKNGRIYMSAFNVALGVTVSLHYQKRSKMQDLPARYIVKWQSKIPGEPQEVRSYTSWRDVECLLRPPVEDVTWLEHLSEQKSRIVVLALTHAFLGRHTWFENDDLKAAKDFLRHLEGGRECMSPLQFEVPSDSRGIIWASIRWVLTRREDLLGVGEGQSNLAHKLLAACGLQSVPVMSV